MDCVVKAHGLFCNVNTSVEKTQYLRFFNYEWLISNQQFILETDAAW